MCWPARVAAARLRHADWLKDRTCRRQVTLAGIDSVMASREARDDAWALVAETLDPVALDRITSEIGLGEVPRTAAELLAGRVRGRVVVRL